MCGFISFGYVPLSKRAVKIIAGTQGDDKAKSVHLAQVMRRIGRCAEAAPASSQKDTAQPLPPTLTGGEIREKFLSYYESKGHTRLQGTGSVLS